MGRVKMQSFIIHSYLTCYQLKTDCCIYRLLYVRLMVTPKQKPIVGTQKIMGKESKHNTIESHQTTREEAREKEKTKMNYQNSQKTSKTMAITTYLSTITLNINGLYSQIKRHIYTTKCKIDIQWEAAAQHREISSVFCDHLERWDREGGREADARGRRYGDICICITDSLCYKAETNTPL